ncbi:MAG TPA: SDR family oxidoreductase [Candidatus Saccharimonadales bacterium]|nr:SDR family oxidoreductase [Candidatus Saccharimonadales bacterium]
MSYELLKQKLLREPKTWLVSGAAGFIGSNLLEALLRLDQKVIGLDSFVSGSRENLDEVRAQVHPTQWANLRLVEGDIRDLNVCQETAKGTQYILHQAAMCSVPGSIEDPLGANDINVTGTLNMMLAAREAGVQAFVYASSSAVYGDSQGMPKREIQVGAPLSPYGATKFVDELYAQVFARCYSLKTVGLRYFNVFGPRQDPNGAYAAVIPKWITALIQDEAPIIYGDGETTRDFCYIDNVVQANLLAATAGDFVGPASVYNIALNQSTSLNQLFKAIQDLLIPEYPHVKMARPIYKPFRAGDILHSEADISLAEKFLGYKPEIGVEAGLRLAIDWYARKIPVPRGKL